MIRTIATVAVMAALGMSAWAGDSGEPQDLYAIALLAAAEARAKAYGRLHGKDYYDVVVAADDSLEPLTKDIPERSGPFRISVLDEEGLRQRYKKQRRLPVLRLYPARFQNGELVVGINEYWFSYRRPLFGRASYGWGLEGGAMVRFRYDCERRAFVVAAVELNGI